MKVRRRDCSQEEFEALLDLLGSDPYDEDIKEAEISFVRLKQDEDAYMKRIQQTRKLADAALMEKNNAQDRMIKYQTLSLVLAEALRREQDA